MKLSELIKQYREENNISQREFGRRCDLSNSLISILEMGKNPQTGKTMTPDFVTYRKLANGMGMSVQMLFEKLDDGAFVSMKELPWENGYAASEEFTRFMTATVPDNLSELDIKLLESVHRNPGVTNLIDIAVKLKQNDLDMLIQMAKVFLNNYEGGMNQ